MNGFVCIPNKIFELKLNVYEFAVMCYLYRCRNSTTGECFPSYNKISTDMNISRSTVIRT
ncbi:MAG: helix-turn-helix domain-containing protein, partial [Oscillospiraceae bacterium]|nr:helix-turn-helix domain-containing protein [Oscillospiraceae bacterium]